MITRSMRMSSHTSEVSATTTGHELKAVDNSSSLDGLNNQRNKDRHTNMRKAMSSGKRNLKKALVNDSSFSVHKKPRSVRQGKHPSEVVKHISTTRAPLSPVLSSINNSVASNSELQGSQKRKSPLQAVMNTKHEEINQVLFSDNDAKPGAGELSQYQPWLQSEEPVTVPSTMMGYEYSDSPWLPRRIHVSTSSEHINELIARYSQDPGYETPCISIGGHNPWNGKISQGSPAAQELVVSSSKEIPKMTESPWTWDDLAAEGSGNHEPISWSERKPKEVVFPFSAEEREFLRIDEDCLKPETPSLIPDRRVESTYGLPDLDVCGWLVDSPMLDDTFLSDDWLNEEMTSGDIRGIPDRIPSKESSSAAIDSLAVDASALNEFEGEKQEVLDCQNMADDVSNRELWAKILSE